MKPRTVPTLSIVAVSVLHDGVQSEHGHTQSEGWVARLNCGDSSKA